VFVVFVMFLNMVIVMLKVVFESGKSIRGTDFAKSVKGLVKLRLFLG